MPLDGGRFKFWQSNPLRSEADVDIPHGSPSGVLSELGRLTRDDNGALF